MDILNEISGDKSPKDIEVCHRVGVSKNNSKKTIVCFKYRKHAKKALTSNRNLRKSLSPNCNVFINENLTVKKPKLLFSVENLNVVIILLKYIQETERCIFQVQKYTEKKY